MQTGILPPYRAFYGISIAFCVKSAVRSIDVVSDVISYIEEVGYSEAVEDIDIQDVLDELQNIVIQGAAVARYFWPIRCNHQIHASRAAELRTIFDITEDNPLQHYKSLRNAMEHFDERIDKYLAQEIVGQIFPGYLGYESPRDGVPKHFFRAYFIDSGVFEVLGEQYKIMPLVEEIIRINELQVGSNNVC